MGIYRVRHGDTKAVEVMRSVHIIFLFFDWPFSPVSVFFMMLLLFLIADMEDEDGTCLLDVLW